jgi:hypothetical protein
MKYLNAFVLLTALVAPAAAQNQTTFRNSQGQTTGTATHEQQRHHHIPQREGPDYWNVHEEHLREIN